MGSHQETRLLQVIKLSTQSDTTTMLEKGVTLRHFVPPNLWKHLRIKRGSSMQHENNFKN
jgi:hypothetical protein